MLFVIFYFIFIYVITGFISGMWPGKDLFLRVFCGYRRILIYGGEYEFNEDFYTVAKFNKNNEIISPVYRFPWCNLGDVTIHSDGTAEYCGSCSWRFA